MHAQRCMHVQYRAVGRAASLRRECPEWGCRLLGAKATVTEGGASQSTADSTRWTKHTDLFFDWSKGAQKARVSVRLDSLRARGDVIPFPPAAVAGGAVYSRRIPPRDIVLESLLEGLRALPEVGARGVENVKELHRRGVDDVVFEFSLWKDAAGQAYRVSRKRRHLVYD